MNNAYRGSGGPDRHRRCKPKYYRWVASPLLTILAGQMPAVETTTVAPRVPTNAPAHIVPARAVHGAWRMYWRRMSCLARTPLHDTPGTRRCPRVSQPIRIICVATVGRP